MRKVFERYFESLFLVSAKGTLKVFERYFEGISKAFDNICERYFKGLSKVFQRYFESLS
jgi:hypothetical protein